jgi:hypothetical protein
MADVSASLTAFRNLLFELDDLHRKNMRDIVGDQQLVQTRNVRLGDLVYPLDQCLQLIPCILYPLKLTG